MKSGRGGRSLTRRTSRAKGALQSVANSFSHWVEPVKEDVEAPALHLVAILAYGVGMILYCVFAGINFVNYPTPTVFESAEANTFAPVPMNVDIDCQDCRVAPGIPGQLGRPGVPKEWMDKKTLWILSWDYTALPGGCAARAPHLFSTALRDFCSAQGSEGLEKCVVKSTDLPLLRQSKSPDPRVAPTANVSWRRGWGGNPNYGNGSRFELLHAVPLCFVADNTHPPAPVSPTPAAAPATTPLGGGPATAPAPASASLPGLHLQIVNIPHHAFTSPSTNIGRAVVALSTPDNSFREQRAFQPWHKNTLHLGMTVDRGANKAVTAVRPWFSNFQYDGRVEWGLEEGDINTAQSFFRDRVLMANALNEHESKIADIAINTGKMSLASALNATKTATGAAKFKQQLAMIEAQLPPGLLQYVDRLLKQGIAPGDVFQYVDPNNADLTSPIHTRRLGLGGDELARLPELTGEQQLGGDHRGGARRRLSGHDEWGGVEYSIRLSHYANVYTAGRRPTAYEVLASVGGASSSLIGIIGLVLAAFELLPRCARKHEQGSTDASSAKPPVAAADLEKGLANVSAGSQTIV
jgi:hypothetical protein